MIRGQRCAYKDEARRGDEKNTSRFSNSIRSLLYRKKRDGQILRVLSNIYQCSGTTSIYIVYSLRVFNSSDVLRILKRHHTINIGYRLWKTRLRVWKGKPFKKEILNIMNPPLPLGGFSLSANMQLTSSASSMLLLGSLAMYQLAWIC